MKNFRALLNFDDGMTARLTVALRCECFEGEGSCYLDIKSFEGKIEKFLDYPLSKSAAPCIEGGYFMNGSLSQTHLKITAFPIGNIGKVALEVELGTPVDKNSSEFRGDFQARLVTSMVLEYEDLGRLYGVLKSCIREPGIEFIVDF